VVTARHCIASATRRTPVLSPATRNRRGPLQHLNTTREQDAVTETVHHRLSHYAFQILTASDHQIKITFSPVFQCTFNCIPRRSQEGLPRILTWKCLAAATFRNQGCSWHSQPRRFPFKNPSLTLLELKEGISREDISNPQSKSVSKTDFSRKQAKKLVIIKMYSEEVQEMPSHGPVRCPRLSHRLPADCCACTRQRDLCATTVIGGGLVLCCRGRDQSLAVICCPRFLF